MTCSESGESGSIVRIASCPSAQERGDSLGIAPSFESSSTGRRERLATVSVNPAFRRFRAMGFPMIPRPTKPTFRIEVTSSLLRRGERGLYGWWERRGSYVLRVEIRPARKPTIPAFTTRTGTAPGMASPPPSER
jgi:hypothetical protein